MDVLWHTHIHTSTYIRTSTQTYLYARTKIHKNVEVVPTNRDLIQVTNALLHLPEADNILWIEDGGIKAQGTYDHLLDQGELC